MRGIRDILIQSVTGGTDSKGHIYNAHNRTIVKNNGIPVHIGQIFDDLAKGDLSSFNALPMDPYGNPVAFSVVVALQYEGFRCLVDYLAVNRTTIMRSQPVPASAAKAAAALVSVAVNVTANLQRLPPGDAREEYQVGDAISLHSLSAHELCIYRTDDSLPSNPKCPSSRPMMSAASVLVWRDSVEQYVQQYYMCVSRSS